MALSEKQVGIETANARRSRTPRSRALLRGTLVLGLVAPTLALAITTTAQHAPATGSIQQQGDVELKSGNQRRFQCPSKNENITSLSCQGGGVSARAAAHQCRAHLINQIRAEVARNPKRCPDKCDAEQSNGFCRQDLIVGMPGFDWTGSSNNPACKVRMTHRGSFFRAFCTNATVLYTIACKCVREFAPRDGKAQANLDCVSD